MIWVSRRNILLCALQLLILQTACGHKSWHVTTKLTNETVAISAPARTKEINIVKHMKGVSILRKNRRRNTLFSTKQRRSEDRTAMLISETGRYFLQTIFARRGSNTAKNFTAVGKLPVKRPMSWNSTMIFQNSKTERKTSPFKIPYDDDQSKVKERGDRRRKARSTRSSEEENVYIYYTMAMDDLKECHEGHYVGDVYTNGGYIFLHGTLPPRAECSFSLIGKKDTVFKFNLSDTIGCEHVYFEITDDQESLKNLGRRTVLKNTDRTNTMCKPLPLVEYSFSNHVRVSISERNRDIRTFYLYLEFITMSTKVANSVRPSLETVLLTNSRGYVQSPGVTQQKPYSHNIDSCLTLRAQEDSVIMTSFDFLSFAHSTDEMCSNLSDYLTLYHLPYCSQLSTDMYQRLCHAPGPRAEIHETDVLSFMFYTSEFEEAKGFKVLFSFHPSHNRPQQLGDRLWNCSVPFWNEFSMHFPCNLEWDCLKGEDELGCIYSAVSSHVTCPARMFRLRHTCYYYGSSDDKREELTWNRASYECQRRGLRLASLSSEEETRSIQNILRYSKARRIYVGLRRAALTSSSLYQHMWRWLDGTIAYYLSIAGHIREEAEVASVKGPETAYSPNEVWQTTPNFLIVEFTNIVRARTVGYLCEDDLSKDDINLNEVPSVIELQEVEVFTSPAVTLVQCPEKHTTHDFLACDVKSACWARDYQICHAPNMTKLPQAFTCISLTETVPYSLVCDFWKDCTDGTDEDFCDHRRCNSMTEIACANKQCIPFIERCNQFEQCTDGSDEYGCPYFSAQFMMNRFEFNRYFVPKPAYVVMDGVGGYSVKTLTDFVECPPTHFQCPRNGYCLPVFTRCNGVSDCPDRQDEADCDSYVCPGYYRCRDSRICVHPYHICDTKYQCPRRDDEILCRATCAQGCSCFGLAWTCEHSAPFSEYPNLRYLEGVRTNITPAELSNNIMLIELRLVHSNIDTFNMPYLPNLRIIDLSDNKLTFINRTQLLVVPNLYSLTLAGNEIVSLFKESPKLEVDLFSIADSVSAMEDESVRSEKRSEAGITLNNLKKLDLSRVKLHEFNPSILTVFPHVQLLNLSHTGLYTVTGFGFQNFSQLRFLDLRGCPLNTFSGDIFRGLNELHEVHSDTYKLCCPSVLPNNFNMKQCHAPSDEVSSCESLLKSNIYRGILALLSTLALLGNLGTFVYRIFVNNTANRHGFGVLVTHLCVSDCLMGIFMAVVGVADQVYRGTYLWNDTTWKRSSACKIAGFLSMLSTEASTFFVCLITLDRFLALRFPFHNLRLSSMAGHLVALMAWVVGFVLAGLPLLPMTSKWEFYGQVGVCLPLPITKADFSGHSYSFGVMIVLNSVLFLLLALGNVFIYWSIQRNKMGAKDSCQTSKDLTIARRLLSVVMTNFVSWFSVSLLGVLDKCNIAISDEVNVAMAIIVLPLNSALNPFLYTFNHLQERRRKVREERFMKWLARQPVTKN